MTTNSDIPVVKTLSRTTADVLDYPMDWGDWVPPGDSITASTWSIPSDLISAMESFTATGTVIWLAGGVFGATYLAVNTIQTAQGRTTARAIRLQM